MADGTLKVGTITTSSGSGTITIGQSGETITIPSGATITNSGTQTGFGGANTPAFQAYRTATQSLSNNVWTKIQNNVELFDTDGAYDNSTNYRFTIPSGKAGKYVILVAVNIHDLGDGKYLHSAIYKNGSVIKEDIISAGRGIPTSIKTITIDDASVGDYYEAYVKNRNDSTRDLNYIYGNVFYAYKIIT
mgnify:CR=1 FL=1